MIITKGGIWTDMEDEILKVAVTKFGENQWSRISILLSCSFFRKSAVQCKARWYEWLHPRIKKMEWTRQEDEMLLHDFKVNPGQWRKIAGGFVGRSVSECIERYERLLDVVCGVDEDVRKLCYGERDGCLESRHPRSDSVDMEANEVRMVSEARARLSNTRGKKGIRKDREKQFEEGRRLVSLQKRRELKAARIDDGNRKMNVKGVIDYNAELFCVKKPRLGFYDATDEKFGVEETKFQTTIEEVEGETRFDKEARLRREDAARKKTRRQDVQSGILQANKLIDQETVRKRPKPNLPAPQILDHQLKHIAKFRSLASDEALT